MKKFLGCAIFHCLMCQATLAIIISPFGNTDSFIKNSKDIVIAECVSIPTNKPVLVNGRWLTEELRDGLYKVEVNVIQSLKGDKQIGRLIVATIYPISPGKKYLLSSLDGGGVGESGGIDGTDFMAVPQLSVVEIPSNFDLSTLDGKELKEQIQSIISGSLFILERKIAPLLEEKKLLEKAISDRQYVWFDSVGPVKTGRIVEVSTTNEHWTAWLNLEDKKLQWSGGMPGKDGYLYFQKIDAPRTPYWEFSFCDATNIESLANKPLKIKFTGFYMPGAGDGSSIVVSVGQVLFARTIDNPDKIFVLQILRQYKSEEMSARCAAIQR